MVHVRLRAGLQKQKMLSGCSGESMDYEYTDVLVFLTSRNAID